MVNNLVKKTAKKLSPAAPKPARPDEASKMGGPMSKSGKDTFDPHMVRSALDTILRAEEIKRDRAMMSAVKKHAAEHTASIDAALGGGFKTGGRGRG